MRTFRAKRDIAVFLLTGSIIAGLFMTSAGAHVGGSVTHLWGHLKSKVTRLVYTKSQSNARYLSKAGTAADSDKLDGSDATDFAPSQAEPWHDIAPADFGACWTNTGAAGRNVAGYYRDPYGVVHLKGSVKRLTAAECSVVIFTLPAGYRPVADENQVTSNMPVDSGPWGLATITIVRSNAPPFSGQVTFMDGDFQHGLFLDGISFRCAPAGADGCP